MTRSEHLAEVRRLIARRLGYGKNGKLAYEFYLRGVLDGLEAAKEGIASARKG